MSASGRSNSWVRRWGSKLWWWKKLNCTMGNDYHGWGSKFDLSVKRLKRSCKTQSEGVLRADVQAGLMISRRWGLNHDFECMFSMLMWTQPRFGDMLLWVSTTILRVGPWGKFSLPCGWGIAMMQTEKVSESVKLPTLNMLSVYCNLSVRGRYYM